MKKIFIALLNRFALMALLPVVCAQTPAYTSVENDIKNDTINHEENFSKNLAVKGRVTWGVKAGYTHAKLRGSEIDFIFAEQQTQWLPGFHAGFALNTQLNKWFWLKHECLFNVKGARVTLIDSIDGDYSSRLKTYYIDLYPANFTLHYKGLQLYAGPYISALAAATLQRKNANGTLFKSKDIYGDASNFEENSKYLQKFDFGFNVGIEFQIPFGLALGARYMHGITDIFQFANSYTLESPKVTPINIHNQCLMISVGYYFNNQ